MQSNSKIESDLLERGCQDGWEQLKQECPAVLNLPPIDLQLVWAAYRRAFYQGCSYGIHRAAKLVAAGLSS